MATAAGAAKEPTTDLEFKSVIDNKLAAAEDDISKKLQESLLEVRRRYAEVRKRFFPDAPALARSEIAASVTATVSVAAQQVDSFSALNKPAESDPDNRQVKRQRLSEEVQVKKAVDAKQQSTSAAVLPSAESMAVDDFAFKEETKASAQPGPVHVAPAPVPPPVVAPAAKGTKKGKGKTSIAVAPSIAAAPPPAAAEPAQLAPVSPAAPVTEQGSAGPQTSATAAAISGDEAKAALAKFMDGLKGKPEQALAAWTNSLVAFINDGLPLDEPHPLAQAMQRFHPVVVAIMLADGVDPTTEVMGRHKVQPLSGDGLKFGKAPPCLDARALLAALHEANCTAGARSKAMVAIRKMQVMLDVSSGKDACTNFVSATAAEMLKGKKLLPACLQRYAAAAQAPVAAAAHAETATPPTKPAARPPALAAKTPAIVRTARKGAPPGSVKPKQIAAALAPVGQSLGAAAAPAPSAQEDDDMSDDGSLPDLDFDVNVQRESNEGSNTSEAAAAAVQQAPTSQHADNDAMQGQEEAIPSLTAASVPVASTDPRSSVGSSTSTASAAFSEASLVKNIDSIMAPSTSRSTAQSADVEMDTGHQAAVVSGPSTAMMPPPPIARTSVSAPIPATPAAPLGQVPTTVAVLSNLPSAMATAARVQVPSATPASATAVLLSTTGKLPVTAIAGPQSGNIASLNAAANAKKAQEEADAKRIEARAALRAQIDQRKAAAAAGVAAPGPSVLAGPTPSAISSVPVPVRSVAAEAEARIKAAEEEKKALTAAAAAARAAEAAAATQGVREKAVAAISAPATAIAATAAPVPSATVSAQVAAKPLAPASAGVGPKAPLSAKKAPLPGGMGLPGMMKPIMPGASHMPAVPENPQSSVASSKQAAPLSAPAATAMPQLHSVPSAATMSAAAAAARILSPSKSSNQLLPSVASPAAKALAAQQAAVMAMAVQQQQLQQQQAAQMFPSALSAAAGHAARPQPVGSDPAENYELSDKGSDSEEEEEERPRKPIPEWARGAALDQALAVQYGGAVPLDPDALFDEIETCDLEAIFPNQKKKRFQKRTSSGLWVGDRLTAAEKEKYRQEMGFAAIQAAQAAASSSQTQVKR